ncbi:unnamed protein product [Cuscuta campestris]|uniref:Pentacotripeptide-repeat region of PRORP domain-containing protein n=1 Tax=Cuscuta campestris TaxID=132261 RepID=A0A484M102_9ASTE|nr:unnamed protein product [Cuscuta campestris]
MCSVSFLGLNRLGLGLLFQSESWAVRWGRNRYCHTNLMRQMKPRKSLWAQIIRPANPKIHVKPKLDNWVKDQKKKAPAGDLKRILLRLRQDGRFHQALQVYEWMRRKGIYKFSSSDYAVQFNLICKVRGGFAADRYVRKLPKQTRNDKYGELLHCYVNEHIEDIFSRPLGHLQKMKKLGFALSPRPFNEIMHIQGPEPKKVLKVLAKLRKSKVLPDNDSYRICISSFGLIYDVDGMERMLREMESQPQIVMDWCTYAVVAEFYDREFLVDKAADALEKARVILQNKGVRRKSPNYLLKTDYLNVIRSLVKLGELVEAMKFTNEWEALGNWRNLQDIGIPYTIIEGYVKNGKLQEAFYSIETWSRKGKIGVDKLSCLLCKEYLKVGNVIQAFNCFRGTRHSSELHPILPMLFFEYIEKKCGSLFPLHCTRSVKPATGTIFLDVNTIGSVQHENSTQALNMDYENIVKSLVDSGKLDEARKMAIKWELSCKGRSSDCLNILKIITEGYCKMSFFVEAEAMAEAWTREKRSQVAEIWFVLASHYQLHGKMVRGFECMRRCFDLTPGLKGNYDMMLWTFMNGIGYLSGMSNVRGTV